MNDLWEWLTGQDAAWWAAAGTWATVLIATAAVFFAYHQVRESRTLREAQAQPFIVVTLEPSNVAIHVVNLRVENIGQTLARDVRFTFTPPLESVWAKKNPAYSLAESRLVKEGLPTMPPGMRIERLFDNALEWEEDKTKITHPLAYDVEVLFSNYKGNAQEPLKYRVDLTVFMGARTVQEKGIHDLANSVNRIRETLDRWNESNSLRVLSRDGDAKDEAEWHEYEERRAERAAEQTAQAQADTESDADA